MPLTSCRKAVVLAERFTALHSALKRRLQGSPRCPLLQKWQLPPRIQSHRRQLMPTHRARCHCRCPNSLANQSRRVCARIACMGSFNLTVKNAKAPCCASICGIRTDAHFANAPIWPSAPTRTSFLFSRETGVGFIYFMLNTYSCRRVGLEGSGTQAVHLSVHLCRGQWQVARLPQGGS